MIIFQGKQFDIPNKCDKCTEINDIVKLQGGKYAYCCGCFPFKNTKIKPSKVRMNRSEYQEQVQVFKYLDLQYPNVLATSQIAGAYLSRTASKKAKNQGYKAGFPDISIITSNKHYHGLYIEMKIKTTYKISSSTGKKIIDKKGTVSEKQKGWLIALNKEGYFACACYGFEDAKFVIDSYMNDKDLFPLISGVYA